MWQGSAWNACFDYINYYKFILPAPDRWIVLSFYVSSFYVFISSQRQHVLCWQLEPKMKKTRVYKIQKKRWCTLRPLAYHQPELGVIAILCITHHIDRNGNTGSLYEKFVPWIVLHYGDDIMCAMASQITNLFRSLLHQSMLQNIQHAPKLYKWFAFSLQWRHNERDCVSNHRRVDCTLNRLLRCRSKKTSKFGVTGLCEGNNR